MKSECVCDHWEATPPSRSPRCWGHDPLLPCLLHWSFYYCSFSLSPWYIIVCMIKHSPLFNRITSLLPKSYMTDLFKEFKEVGWSGSNILIRVETDSSLRRMSGYKPSYISFSVKVSTTEISYLFFNRISGVDLRSFMCLVFLRKFISPPGCQNREVQKNDQ